MAQAHCVQVDPAFVQAPEHRPKAAISDADGVPLVDLSPLFSDSAGDTIPATLLSHVEVACRDWGFFQVINHGVPLEVLKKAEATEKKFFALPEEEKLKVRRDEANRFGYYESEHTKNVRDWKRIFDFVLQDRLDVTGLVLKNRWPEVPLDFRETIEEYAKCVEKLAFIVLELISLTLNLPPKYLNAFFEEQTTFVRLNHYPPCPYPDLALGVGHHKDSGALTVLYQDSVGGLDVKRQSDGEWVRVKPIPNSFVINVGDIIQVWSNDKYLSAEHRVSVNTERDRFSIPFFFNPASSIDVRPLPELVDDRNPGKYKEYNWGEFFKRRMDSDFKKLEVENIQIDHFKRA
ncbi:2-oxoglutarate (2OG) and Fe(II)-dependent oxygenase superfamily protein [Rhynchospora pubera]|uniref:2-oxoglutarate (2OG) and Fe(II)-dependent oxygenase superfamily protein n=1 Tax=Rhynchospora pubera TaxID=906938 RepID=A0AAV8GFG3_9POAL|nr:2-oxoglutarate (2OG) and Fe(II)-dependent oxygenase superfamily protein [Rhynchospora pubera]